MLDNKAKSIVTIMIVVAVSTLLLRIVIEQIIKLNIEQNESSAQTTLKLISTSLENYANNHQGVFPDSLFALTSQDSRYLDKDYITQSPIKGYNYNCSKMEPAGYNCAATPVKCNLTGGWVYNVTTGGLFVSEKCGKKE